MWSRLLQKRNEQHQTNYLPHRADRTSKGKQLSNGGIP